MRTGKIENPTSAAQKGANSDITSLAGLTTPLSTGQGGTGSTAAANAASGVVVLNGSSQLPAVSGALLTNLPAGGARSELFTSSGTFTPGTGVTLAFLTMIGGGGGGAGGNAANAGGGGEVH